MSLFTYFVTVFCVRAIEVFAHFLWQALLIAAVTWLVLRFLRPPALRYAFCLSALLVLTLCPIVTFLASAPLLPPDFDRFTQMLDPQGRGDYSTFELLFAAPGSELSGLQRASSVPFHMPELTRIVQSLPDTGWIALAPLLLTVYLTLVLFLILRLAQQLLFQYHTPPGLHPCYDPGWLRMVDACRRRAHLNYQPPVYSADSLQRPTCVGLFRPLLLLPGTVVDQGHIDDAEALVSHTFLRVHKRLGLWMLYERLLEIAFFFHPATWWLTRQTAAAREVVFACGETTPVQTRPDSLVASAHPVFHPRGHRAHCGRSLKEGAVCASPEMHATKDRRHPDPPAFLLYRPAPLTFLALCTVLALVIVLFVARIPEEYPPMLVNITSEYQGDFEAGLVDTPRIAAGTQEYPVLAVVDSIAFRETGGEVFAQISINSYRLTKAAWSLALSLQLPGGTEAALSEMDFQVTPYDPDPRGLRDRRARAKDTFTLALGPAESLSGATTYTLAWQSQ